MVLTSAVVFAPAQTLAQKPLPTKPLENYDNVPALLRPTQVSPGMVSQFGNYTSYQVNVNSNGQNIVGDAANEPSICANLANRSQMAIGWRQFDSVSSNFRQAGWAYTTNGGTSWTFPGVLENNVFRSDPVLNADATGNFFYLSLLETFFDNQWRSQNHGQSWTDIASADGGDKQWFTIDNTNSSGRGFQYQAWSTAGNNYNGRQFTRSVDGGVSWLNPINIPKSPVWGTLDVDSSGNLFIGGVNMNTNQIWCIRSISAKNSNVVPSFEQSTAVSLGGSISSSDTINPEGLTGQVFLVVDRSGTSTNNNIYMLASVRPTGASNGADVMFVRSSDSGQTFTSPRRINDDAVNQAKWHWFGTLSVAPNGRIDSVWLDSRNAANNTDSQLFYSYSTDGGGTWAANVAVSQPFNPFLGYPNQDKMGDYITMVSDNAGGNVAYCATFNQEEDIYYVRVAPGATPTPTPTPTPTVTPTPSPTPTPTPTPGTIKVTVGTSPSALTFTVDGNSYTSTQTFSWQSASTHTISTTSPQSGGTGQQYVWNHWTGGGGAISHTVAPIRNTTYTAVFKTQYYLTMSAGTGGKVTPASGFKNAGATVSITGKPSAGYQFNGWSGSGSGAYSGTNNPASIIMNGPVSETGSFTH